MKNWERLKAIARQAGYRVNDDGVSVQLWSPTGLTGVFFRHTDGPVTGYQAACEWLQRQGVHV